MKHNIPGHPAGMRVTGNPVADEKV